MINTSLTALARQHLEKASAASSGRSAQSVVGGHDHMLHQTMIALVAGQKLDDHANPGNATVQVIHGRVRLDSGNDSWEGATGHLIEVPDAIHSVTALEDAVILLTAVNRP